MPMSQSNDAEPDESGIASGTILRRGADGSLETLRDPVAVEEPLEILAGDQTVSVTMRTPGNDDELAAGFLATEGLVTAAGDIRDMHPCRQTAHPGNTMRVLLRKNLKLDPPARYGTITSSCGVCGKMAIDAIRVRCPDLLTVAATLDAALLLGLPERLREAQSNFQRTGGLHAAGLFDLKGELKWLREDIGRHNAVDKVLGRAFLDGAWPLHESVLLVSGRVSFEIVQKALAAGVPIVAAISAPSTLAVEFARESGQTLVAFLRPPTMNVYAHPQRVRFGEGECGTLRPGRDSMKQ